MSQIDLHERLRQDDLTGRVIEHPELKHRVESLEALIENVTTCFRSSSSPEVQTLLNVLGVALDASSARGAEVRRRGETLHERLVRSVKAMTEAEPFFAGLRTAKPLVVIESPYAGDVEGNLAYAKRCVHDCLRRGEAPYASHLFFTQPGILDDLVPEERRLGIESGFAWGAAASVVAVYVDRGISGGMREGIAAAASRGAHIEVRALDRDVTPEELHAVFKAAATSDEKVLADSDEKPETK